LFNGVLSGTEIKAKMIPQMWKPLLTSVAQCSDFSLTVGGYTL